jgi:hypothetical protein
LNPINSAHVELTTPSAIINRYKIQRQSLIHMPCVSDPAQEVGCWHIQHTRQQKYSKILDPKIYQSVGDTFDVIQIVLK